MIVETAIYLVIFFYFLFCNNHVIVYKGTSKQFKITESDVIVCETILTDKSLGMCA